MAHLQHYLSSMLRKGVVVEAQRKSWLPYLALVAYPTQKIDTLYYLSSSMVILTVMLLSISIMPATQGVLITTAVDDTAIIIVFLITHFLNRLLRATYGDFPWGIPMSKFVTNKFKGANIRCCILASYMYGCSINSTIVIMRIGSIMTNQPALDMHIVDTFCHLVFHTTKCEIQFANDYCICILSHMECRLTVHIML